MVRRWLAQRSTGDLLVLLIASTICFTVLATGFTIGLLAVIRPETDTSNAGRVITDIINTLLGLLSGFLAGRTDLLRERERERERREKQDEDAG